MFFVRKRSANVASAKGFRLCGQQQHNVGHSGVFTGCEVLSLSSFISADVWTSDKSNPTRIHFITYRGGRLLYLPFHLRYKKEVRLAMAMVYQSK
jgi:hypothetical protein